MNEIKHRQNMHTATRPPASVVKCLEMFQKLAVLSKLPLIITENHFSHFLR